MKSLFSSRQLILALACWLVACSDKTTTPRPQPNPGPSAPGGLVDKNWQFEAAPFWADDFTGTGAVDSAKWGYDVGGHGWGNNELQYYTTGAANAKMQNGMLTIEARKESVSGRIYTSARLVTKGKGDFLYGRFEIRAKLPKGRGTWPAIWMLATDNVYGGWPASGEIDIMEHVGFDLNKVHSTVHTSAYNHTLGTQRGASVTIPTATDDFHVYRTDWTPYAIRSYIDGEKYFEFINQNNGSAAWPFDKKFHLLLNIAVGGNWGGTQGVDETAFPARMEVDYVRVYKMIE